MPNASTLNDWSKPAATAIPKEGYFTLEQGRYGPTYPRTPASHGFTIIAKIKPGTEGEIRAYGEKIEDTITASPHALAPLQLHYPRWVLFDIGSDKYFMYQGIFDTDFDKYRLPLDERVLAVRIQRFADVPSSIDAETLSDLLMLSDHLRRSSSRRAPAAARLSITAATRWSVLRGIRLGAVAAEQSLQLGDLSWLD